MKIGTQVLVKYGLGLVKGVVIDIDLTFVTLKVEYKKGKTCTLKLKHNSDSIVRYNGIDTEAFNQYRFIV